MKGRFSRTSGAAAAASLAIALACGLALAPTSVATTTASWSGAETYTGLTSLNWSQAGNWTGAIPSSPLASLQFGALSAACNATSTAPTVTSCYQSTDDLGPLSVGQFELNDAEPYLIVPAQAGADTLTLDPAGVNGVGLSASPLGVVPTADETADLAVPVVLADGQTWTIGGTPPGTAPYESGIEVDTVSGNQPLTVDFTDSGTLSSTTLATGPVTVSGGGDLAAEELEDASGHVTDAQLPPAGLTLEDGASLYVESADAKSGPITFSGGQDAAASTLALGQTQTSGGADDGSDATLAVNGAVELASATGVFFDLSHDGATPSADFSQLAVTGNLSLAGASFYVEHGHYDANGDCAALTVGDTFPLVTAGSITGDLTYFDTTGQGRVLTPGAVSAPLPVKSDDCPAGMPFPTARLSYGAHSITITVVGDESGSALATVNSALITGLAKNRIDRALAGVLRPHGLLDTIPNLLADGGYRFAFTAPEAGRLRIVWTTKVGRRRETVATGTLVVKRAGKRTLRVALTAAGRSLLSHSPRLRITTTTSFTVKAHASLTRTGSFTIASA